MSVRGPVLGTEKFGEACMSRSVSGRRRSQILGGPMRRSRVLGAVLMTMAGLAVPVAGGTLYDFETPAYSGSPTGTSIAGQNVWTTPTGAASVYTYAANAPGLAVNPNGGAQFLGIVQANPNPNTASPASRGRQSLDLSTSNLWMFSYDLIAASPGVARSEE